VGYPHGSSIYKFDYEKKKIIDLTNTDSHPPPSIISNTIEQVKVQWKHFGLDEATWEMTDQMRPMYPSLFVG